MKFGMWEGEMNPGFWGLDAGWEKALEGESWNWVVFYEDEQRIRMKNKNAPAGT
jgi:hypothetical protein